MKKWIGIITIMGMIFLLAACGSTSGEAEEPEAAPEETTEETAEESEEEGTGIANPWSEAASLEEAAEGADIDGFYITEVITISLGDVKPDSFRYMDGLAETTVEFPAVEMTIRKGKSDVATEGDISGDYNTYANEWTQNVKGLELKCFGNREGDATKTIWTVDDYCYSITVQGLGGDEDYGLSPDDLNSLINGIQ